MSQWDMKHNLSETRLPIAIRWTISKHRSKLLLRFKVEQLGIGPTRNMVKWVGIFDECQIEISTLHAPHPNSSLSVINKIE